MPTVSLVLLIIAYFLALKAIEHRGDAPMYPVCSIAAWIALATGLLTWLV